jgi:hypothetical protein
MRTAIISGQRDWYAFSGALTFMVRTGQEAQNTA